MNIVLSSIAALNNPKESARITLLLLAKELQKLGHDIRIIAKETKHKPNSQINSQTYNNSTAHIEGIPIYRTKLFQIPKLLSQLNKEKKIDIIHLFSASPIFLLPHLFSPGKKIHSLKSYSKNHIGQMGYSFLLLADAITVPTNCFAAKIPFKKSFNKNKIHLIGSPIDVNKFYPKTSQNSTSPSDKNPKNNNRKKTSKIMYYGALTVHKGANLLFEIIPLVIAKKPNTHFYIFPRHTNIDHWREKAKTAGIDQYCTFNTNEVDIAQEVRNSDLIILPYVNLRGTDGNPSCLLEAMTCEVPIVTANLPELVEITQNTVALSVPHPQAFASQILSSLDHYHSQNLKDAAKLAQNYAAPSIAKQLDNLYKDL